MSDLNVPAAGRYPDDLADESTQWGDGTGWTDNTRPLNSTPAAATPPPVPAAVAAVRTPDWYPDPQNAAAERYFDGVIWTPLTRLPGDKLPIVPPELWVSDSEDDMDDAGSGVMSGPMWKAFMAIRLVPIFGMGVVVLFVAMTTPGSMSSATKYQLFKLAIVTTICALLIGASLYPLVRSVVRRRRRG